MNLHLAHIDYIALLLFSGALMLFGLTSERAVRRRLDRAECRHDIREFTEELEEVIPVTVWPEGKGMAHFFGTDDIPYDPDSDTAEFIARMNADCETFRHQHAIRQ